MLEADLYRRPSFVISMTLLQFSNDGMYLAAFAFPSAQSKYKIKEIIVSFLYTKYIHDGARAAISISLIGHI